MTADDMVCDFCSAKPVVARFTIPAGGVAGAIMDNDAGESLLVAHTDDGEWAACAECRHDIVQGDRQAVENRSVRNFPRGPMSEEFARMTIRTLQAVFFSQYDGSIPSASL